MRILFLAHRVPYPPNKGDKIRSFHQLEYLGKRHSVVLMAFADEKEDLDYGKNLEEYCERVEIFPLRPWLAKAFSLRALCTGSPLSSPYFFSPRFARAVKDLLNRGGVDLLFAFSSPMAQYFQDISFIPRVVDLVDADSEKWQQYAQFSPFPLTLLYRREARLLRAWEKGIVEEADRTLVITERERRLIEGDAPSGKISVLSNGVDSGYFQPAQEPGEGEGLVFTGALDYFPNVDGVKLFAQKILPEIHRRMGEVPFFVVGSHPKKEVLILNGRNGIIVHPNVPDTRPYLERAAVAVCPLRICRGIQNKVLEAMAMGKAVVVTPHAFEGIQAEPGRDLVVAEVPDAFCEEVVSLLADPERRRILGQNARRVIEEKYRWEETMAGLEGILKRVREGFGES